MGMRHHRRRDRRKRAQPIHHDGLVRLVGAPAVVSAPRDQMDHLPQLPAYVAAPQTARDAVKTHLKRIAQSKSPDLGTDHRAPGSLGRGGLRPRVVGRDAVGERRIAMVDVDSQNRSQQIGDILTSDIQVGRRRRRAVPCRHIQIPVGPELEVRAIVFTRKPGEQHLLGRRVHHQRIERAEFEPREFGAVLASRRERVAHEDLPCVTVLWMQSDAKGMLKVGMQREQIDQKVHGLRSVPGIKGGDFPAPLDHEQPTRAADRREFQTFDELQLRQDCLLHKCLGRLGGTRHLGRHPRRTTRFTETRREQRDQDDRSDKKFHNGAPATNGAAVG